MLSDCHTALALACIRRLRLPYLNRDIESSSILLGDKNRTKLRDFDASRRGPINQTHITTHVLRTFWLLGKGGIYSFGVVLVELLTGEKAMRSTAHEDKSLASWFLCHMEKSFCI